MVPCCNREEGTEGKKGVRGCERDIHAYVRKKEEKEICDREGVRNEVHVAKVELGKRKIK